MLIRPFVLRALLAASVALLLAPTAARAQRVFDLQNTPRAKFVAPLAVYPAPSYRAKDFTLVKKDGWYHLFYTRVRRYSPDHYGSPGAEILNETTFGHAVSPDLETWFGLDSVLTVHPGSWDSHHLWAPSVVQKNGVWWMFFTGVTDLHLSASPTDWVPRWQTIGAAYSTDPLLQTWTRVSTPVWQPCSGNGLPGVSWALCNPTLPGGTADFRDPFVLPPNGTGSPWLLYYTARPRTDQYNYVVGVAQSGAGPGGSWSDVGALWDTYSPSSNSKLESPHVFEHGGRWNMFTTGDDSTTGILWSTALVPATGPWQAHGPITNLLYGKKDVPYDYDLDPEHWFASEYFTETGPSTRADYFCVVHAYDPPPQYLGPGGVSDDISIIEFRQMIWNPDGTFELAAPSPVRSIAASAPRAAVGETVRLSLAVDSGAGRLADLEVTRIVGPQRISVAPSVVGLPATVALDNGPMTINWLVRAGIALPATLEIRIANQPLPLWTHVTLVESRGSGDPAAPELPITRALPGMRKPGPGPLDPEPIGLSAREIGSTPLGDKRNLLVEMPGTGRARIDLYDVHGRRVRALADRDLPRGATIESWDGRDDAGHPVSRGIYFARVTTPFGVAHARFLVID